MIRVEWENSMGEHIVIGKADDEDGARRVMMRYLTARGTQVFYTRYWRPQPNHTIIDYGSHSRFIHFYTVE